MSALRVEPLAEPRHAAYDAFVAEHPRGSVFHTRAWSDTIAGALGATVRTLVAVRGRELAGVLPLALASSQVRGRRLVALPLCRFLPLLTDGDPDATEALVAGAVRLARAERCRFLELRCGPGLPEPPGARSRAFFDNYTVDLSGGPEALWRGFHPRSVRRSIRVARRSPVRVRVADDAAAFEALHRLDRAARRRQGVPAHPREFVLGLGRRFAPDARALLLLAEHEGRPIAAELALVHGDTVHGILAADAGPEARRMRVNHLLLHEAMLRSIERGATRFDLGPAHRGNAGLVAFKRYLGAASEPADTWTLPIAGSVPDDADLDRRSVRAVRRAIRWMPPALHSALSSALVREVA